MKVAPKQMEVLQFILGRTEGPRALPPTRREICDQLGWKNLRTAVDTLRALERKGLLELPPGLQRGIFLTEAGLVAAKPAKRRAALVAGVR